MVSGVNEGMITFVAPLTVVLGAGLFAAGILSFFGIHFFKSKTRERAALAGGLALIVLTEIMFATSGLSTRFLNGQRSNLLQCRMEAESALPLERHKSSRLIHEHIVRCMSDYGYEWTEASRRCKEEPVSTKPFCYLPTRTFDRIVTQVQMAFE